MRRVGVPGRWVASSGWPGLLLTPLCSKQTQIHSISNNDKPCLFAVLHVHV